MKGVGWVVILLGLLGVAYLLMHDLQAVKGERAGKAVMEPVEKANEAMEKVRQTTRRSEAELDRIDKAGKGEEADKADR